MSKEGERAGTRDAAASSLVSRARAIADLWWVRLPRVSSRISASLWQVTSDGHVINASAVAAAVLPPLACVGGLVVGWQRFGYDVVVTESTVVVAILIAVGFVSGQLGLLMWTGFCAGDWMSADPLSHTAGFVDFRIPYLVLYVALAAAVVGIPALIKALLLGIPRMRNQHDFIAVPIALAASAVLAFVLIDLWTAATPVVARTVFFWQGISPTSESIFPLQEQGYVVGRAVAVVAMVRIVGITWITKSPSRLERIIEVELAVQPSSSPPLVERIPVALRAGAAACITVALMASIVGSLLRGIVLFVPLFIIQLVRYGALTVPPLEYWKGIANRVPLLVRLVFLFLVARAVVNQVLTTIEVGYPQLSGVIVGLTVLGLILVPGERRAVSALVGAEELVGDPYGSVYWGEPELNDGQPNEHNRWLPGDYMDGVAPDGSRSARRSARRVRRSDKGPTA